MELNITERLLLAGLLPKQGDILTLRVVQDLRKALSFSEEEHAALGFKQDGDKLEWNSETDIPVEIPVGPKAQEIVAARLKELDEAEKLEMNLLPLYELFVEGENAGDTAT